MHTKEKYTVVITDIATGEEEEKSFESLRKAEALVDMLDMARGDELILEVFDSKGKKII